MKDGDEDSLQCLRERSLGNFDAGLEMVPVPPPHPRFAADRSKSVTAYIFVILFICAVHYVVSCSFALVSSYFSPVDFRVRLYGHVGCIALLSAVLVERF